MNTYDHSDASRARMGTRGARLGRAQRDSYSPAVHSPKHPVIARLNMPRRRRTIQRLEGVRTDSQTCPQYTAVRLTSLRGPYPSRLYTNRRIRSCQTAVGQLGKRS